MIIDATNLLLGRIGTKDAKAALNGEKVDIINSGKALISGDKKKIMAEYERKREMGIPSKGPYYHRRPEMLLKRSIRNMLPLRKTRGQEALKRIKCHRGTPESLKGKTADMEGADKEKLPVAKYISIEEICKKLGAKI